ncbi:MAG: 6-hydroxycyclohex-1-ene-1-carbonyl-CoA dehydrogenase [Candidatus Neomarinimicrobiota bacterium]|nr:MAG: 6-hydroxycyclohex-1-ene-1-carbonyl-CoA dehydrogenase [Candidatus Neomarinimicrobiota bacterium]
MMYAYQMTARDAPFERVEQTRPEPEVGQALVQVAGCGVCHTDISYWHHGVPTRHALPLTLGHEIAGEVVAGDPRWVGKAVVVPAVLPCGSCELCRSGRSNICQHQQMPGNDFDGGFATHVLVPDRYLIPVPDSLLDSYRLEELAVVADAVSTPFQVVRKSGLAAGDLAVLIGVGGIGLYAAQIATQTGAVVIAIDIDEQKLNQVREVGVGRTIHSRGMDIKSIKAEVKAIAKESGVSPYQWKIFELSGTRPGQELAYALLGIAGTLSIVGFTLDKVEVRLSNLMAFDATVVGTWGCKPELYPEVLQWVDEGRIKIKPFIELVPLSEINTVFQSALQGSHLKRPVLVPEKP